MPGGTGQNSQQPLSQRAGKPPPTAKPTDPNVVAGAKQEAQQTQVAKPTSGSDRLTFLVPYDCTIVNLGAESPPPKGVEPKAPAGSKPKPRRLDAGISGRTDTHVDFRTNKAGARTVVTLGGPAKKGPFSGDAVPCSCSGYGMATEKGAFHYAKQHQYFLSNGGDLIVRAASGKAAVLQAAHVAEVNGGQDVAITGKSSVLLGAGPFSKPTPKWNTPWKTTAHSVCEADVIAGLGQAGSFAATAVSVAGSFGKTIQVGTEMAPGLVPYPFKIGKYVQAAGYISSALGLAARAPRSVRMSGKGGVAVSAGKSAGLWGTHCASVSSAVVAALVGGTADVKGLVHAGVFGGKLASLVGLVQAVVKGLNVYCHCPQPLHVTSSKSVGMQGWRYGQFNGGARVAAYGTKSARVVGATWGMLADDTGVSLSEMGSWEGLFGTSEAMKLGLKVTTATVMGRDADGGLLELTDGTFTLGTNADDCYLKFKGTVLHHKRVKGFSK